jgi:hypothetical protein
MTDHTPSQSSAPAAPDLTAEHLARAAAARWRTRRVPLAVAGATLLLGCVLGAGATALGAAATSVWTDGGGHSRSERDDDSRHAATPAPTPTATPTAIPSPSAS